MREPVNLDFNGAETRQVLFSVSRDYFDAARHQLHSLIPAVTVKRVAPDAGVLVGEGIDAEHVAALSRSNQVIFVRHLARIQSEVESREGRISLPSVTDVALAVLRTEASLKANAPISLQLWSSGFEPADESRRPDLVRRALALRLSDAGWSIRRSGSPFVLSILLTRDRAYAGVGAAADSLVDWPGGRVGLAKSPDRVSRSEFKLEELFQTFDLNLPERGHVLDLGASPGGWTRVMRQHGFRVTAVDPARLDPRLAGDPKIEYVKMAAGGYLARSNARFDVILNDMRMPADLSVSTMLEARRLLARTGKMIMTLKLYDSEGGRPAVESVLRSLRRLETEYEILFARQLFHNRHEVTVVARTRNR